MYSREKTSVAKIRRIAFDTLNMMQFTCHANCIQTQECIPLLCTSRNANTRVTLPLHRKANTTARSTTVPASSVAMLRVLAYNHLTNTSYQHTFIRVQNAQCYSSIWSLHSFIVILPLAHSLCCLSQPLPKPVLHRLRSNASCFSLQDPLFSFKVLQ